MEVNDQISENKNARSKISWLRFVRDRRQIHCLPDRAIFEEVETARISVSVITMLGGFIFLILLWACMAPVTEVAVSIGEIIPKGKIPIVQHLEGGIVQKVLVKDGDLVKAGQLLVALDPTATRANLQQMQHRKLALELNAKRLNSFVGGTRYSELKFDSQGMMTKNNVANPQHLRKLYLDEFQLLQAEQQAKRDQLKILKAQMAQREGEVARLRNEYDIQKKQIALFQREHKIYKALEHKHVVSQVETIRFYREKNAADAKLLEIKTNLNITRQALKEVKYRYDEVQSQLAKTALKDKNEVMAQLLEVNSKVDKLTSQYERSMIRAPVSGIVKGLSVSPGKVIMPGEAVMEIVPSKHELFVETRIKTHDIGHVKRGDRVKVRVGAYDFARYGSIEGKLITISPATYLDDNKIPYYKGLIQLSKQTVGKHEIQYPLLPGMTVEADIITGSKTIMQYLLKPIHNISEKALGER